MKTAEDKMIALQRTLYIHMDNELKRGSFQEDGIFGLPLDSPYNELVAVSNALSSIMQGIENIIEGAVILGTLCLHHMLER